MEEKILVAQEKRKHSDSAGLANSTVSHKKKTKRMIAFGVVILYLIGVLFGNLIIRISTSQSSQFIIDTVQNQFNLVNSQTFTRVLINSITATLGVIILLYLLGFFALSQIFTAICMLAKGMVFGSMASFVIKQYGIKGMVYIMLTQLISAVLMIFLLSLCARESVMFSTALLKRAKNPKVINIDTKLYNLRFLVFVCFGIGIAFIESVCIILFRGYIL